MDLKLPLWVPSSNQQKQGSEYRCLHPEKKQQRTPTSMVYRNLNIFMAGSWGLYKYKLSMMHMNMGEIQIDKSRPKLWNTQKTEHLPCPRVWSRTAARIV